MAYQTLLVDTQGPVGRIRLNRADALNALNDKLMDELTDALNVFEADEKIGCILLLGSEKAFAAGADIKEMIGKTFSDVVREDFITRNWERLTRCRKPVIAAVAGYVLGGGCEVAMMCDIILAADNAKFGQPEISIGIVPGAGGSQRLARFVGKAKTMEMCLTGRMMDAAEAERSGLVSRVVPIAQLEDEAMKVANRICELSRPAIMLAKEAVNRAFETTLAEGVRFERKVFHSLFATEDRQEGMAAFVEKRKPQFNNK